MSSTGANKTWIYLVAGAAALVLGAVIFNSFSSKGSSMQVCLEDIDALGPIQRDSKGMLTFPYFKDIFTIVAKHSKVKFAEDKKELLGKRRKALREGDESLYR